MKGKLRNNVFYKFNEMSDQIRNLQEQIYTLNQKLEVFQSISSTQLMRVKNGESLSDDYILNARSYNDMSPESALEYYNQNDTQFILLDVSSKDFTPSEDLPEALKIPIDDLNFRYNEITSRKTQILVISEDGVSSIRACEFLNEMGFFNINNVSGGYKYWRGFQLENKQLKMAS
jgi:rhodanese-related sulfurtransferase